MRICTQTVSEMTTEVRTPRPNPKFFMQPQTFSTKKERGTPKDALPPRPPVKSAPPLSRVFQQRQMQQRAQVVSFRSEETSILSPRYDECRRELYFDQCFDIVDKVGVGSFGEVFKVRSREDGNLYAVKRSRDRFKGEMDRRMKLEEVAKHEKLPKHPNCVNFVSAWEERHHLYIQTELCQGSLSDYAEEHHNIPEKLIWNYLVDLLMAVKHLHDHDLVHMDIKPDNVFLGFDGVCKLGDFGLVLDLALGSDYSEAQEGDPKYLAPELMMGRFGKAADVFSLGISILELASDLDLPRGGDTWHQLRSGNMPEEFLQGISEELKEVIRLTMEPEPTLRPTAEQLLNRPSVKEVWNRRKREQITRKTVSCLKTLVQSFLCLLLTIWLTVTYPLQSVMPESLKKIQTPPRPEHTRHPSDWDHSFSDDDAMDCDISINNNSMGSPLDTSTSSDESFNKFSGFTAPVLKLKSVPTTPGWRHRMLRSHTPQICGSPKELTSNGYCSSSPISSPVNLSFRHEASSIMDDNAFHDIEKPESPVRGGMGPKNLMQAFLVASSEEEDYL